MVLDPSINAEQMEMYADVDARAGVLGRSVLSSPTTSYADLDPEPEGIIEIKSTYRPQNYLFCFGQLFFFFSSSVRREKLLGLMGRLDTEYATFKQISKDSSKTAEERASAAEKLVKRETHLQPTYKQLALLYADLHE